MRSFYEKLKKVTVICNTALITLGFLDFQWKSWKPTQEEVVLSTTGVEACGGHNTIGIKQINFGATSLYRTAPYEPTRSRERLVVL